MPTPTPQPAVPGTPEESRMIPYILTYRQNRMTHRLNFEFKGTWGAAMTMAREFCSLMMYEFVNMEYMFQHIHKIVERGKESVKDETHIVRPISWTPNADEKEASA
jgi:hypothetical protein